MCVSAVRYLGVLKFREIKTGYHLIANIALLKKFMQVQQLAFSVHPDAPEVYQIISKNISTNKDETREVMLFIADDKRILINSHFVGNLTISLPSRNYNEMCKRLAAWIERHKMENADTAIVTANY